MHYSTSPANMVCIFWAPVSGRCTDHIIIGTAGTVLDWILKKKAFDPNKIKLFVLDEADVMIAQQGQQDQTVRIQK